MLEWAQGSPKRVGRFIPDGPLDWEGWTKAPLRVLFLMKEAYDVDGIKGKWLDGDFEGSPLGQRWTLPSLVKKCFLQEEEALPKTWKNIFLWAQAMRSFDPSTPPSDELPDRIDDYTKVLMQCAVVNIKKSHGKKESRDADLLAYLEGLSGDKPNAEWLESQVEILNPEVVICCGTYLVLRKLWKDSPIMSDARPQVWDVHQHGKRFWFDYWHPAWHQVSPFLLLQGIHAMRVRFEKEYGAMAIPRRKQYS